MIHGAFDRGGHCLLLVAGGPGRLPLLLRCWTRFTRQTRPSIKTAADLRKHLVLACFPNSPIVGSAASNFRPDGTICGGVKSDACLIGLADYNNFDPRVMRGCFVLADSSRIAGMAPLLEALASRYGIAISDREEARKRGRADSATTVSFLLSKRCVPTHCVSYVNARAGC